MSSEPQPPKLPIKDGDNVSLTKAVKQAGHEYLQHVSHFFNHSDVSKMRAEGFRAIAPSAPGIYRDKFGELANGFGRVGLVDSVHVWGIHRHLIPQNGHLDQVTGDLILDLAFMRLRIDPYNLDPSKVRAAVQEELQSLLSSLGVSNPNKEDSDVEFIPKEISFDDVVKYALSADFDLKNLAELQVELK